MMTNTGVKSADENNLEPSGIISGSGINFLAERIGLSAAQKVANENNRKSKIKN
jgi:hypothetical protein